VVLSIDMDKTSEANVLKAIENAKLLLDSRGILLTSYSSYSDTSTQLHHWRLGYLNTLL